MKNFKKRYRELETQVLHALRTKVQKAGGEIRIINKDDFQKIVLLHDRLFFMDAEGHLYDLFHYGTTLEDLIDCL